MAFEGIGGGRGAALATGAGIGALWQIGEVVGDWRFHELRQTKDSTVKKRPWWRWGRAGPLLLSGLLALATGLLVAAEPPHEDRARTMGGMQDSAVPGFPQSTADHTQFEILQQDFESGPAVTKACLSCHTEASQQLMKTSHWTWICPRAREELAERQGRPVGKGEHVVNNFCIALASNEPRCTSCHAGYGWRDKTFDFDDETLVDCLVCHDTTQTYRKFPVDAGHPNYVPKEWPKGSGNVWQPPDLGHIARHVGKPTRHNCGACHFWGGGGEGVKHGDMDATLTAPDRSLDVHMHAEGLNFQCTECHTTREHKIAGRCFTIPAITDREYVIRGSRKEYNLLACESCHAARPHVDEKLNDHTDKVSCQACHIPTFARERPTKMWWDWSEAGRKTPEGAPIVEKATLRNRGETAEVVTYMTKKGAFEWAINEVPEYRWFNGHVEHTFMGDKLDDRTPARQRGLHAGQHDKIDLDQPVIEINRLLGEYEDPDARIWPVKVHRGKQPYDPVNKTLVVPHLFGKKGSGAYWADYDWEQAIASGMEYANQPYSGEYGFIQTEMSWPLAHMVAPAEDAVRCEECHRPEGRLARLSGFYMPGRDGHALLDMIGILMIVGTILGVACHGGLRIILARRGGAK